MKKIFSVSLTLLLMIATFSGCGAAPSENGDASQPDGQQSAETEGTTISNETEDSNNMDSNATAKSLVVYFSMPETTDSNNMSRYVRVGNSWSYICVLVDLFNREIIGYSAEKIRMQRW